MVVDREVVEAAYFLEGAEGGGRLVWSPPRRESERVNERVIRGQETVISHEMRRCVARLNCGFYWCRLPVWKIKSKIAALQKKGVAYQKRIFKTPMTCELRTLFKHALKKTKK